MGYDEGTLLFLLNVLKGSGGGGSSGQKVGVVSNGGSFPTQRPSGDPLENGDYVSANPASTFPFTISGCTFSSATDKAVYFEGSWAIESGGASSWDKVANKPFEELSSDFKVVNDALKVDDTVYSKKDYVDDLVNDTKVELDDAKVDKVEGKGLSTNDLTNALLTELQNKYTKSEVDNLLASARSVKVVATLPSPTIPNTMYYVGTTTPYHIYLYDSDNQQIDMGTSELDLTDYQKKEDEDLETTSKSIVGGINELKEEVDEKSIVSVSSTGSATDTVKYITINGTQHKLAGEGGGGGGEAGGILYNRSVEPITLLSSGWDTNNEQTIELEIPSGADIDIVLSSTATQAQLFEASNCIIRAISNTTTDITFKSINGINPSVDLPIDVIILDYTAPNNEYSAGQEEMQRSVFPIQLLSSGWDTNKEQTINITGLSEDGDIEILQPQNASLTQLQVANACIVRAIEYTNTTITFKCLGGMAPNINLDLVVVSYFSNAI